MDHQVICISRLFLGKFNFINLKEIKIFSIWCQYLQNKVQRILVCPWIKIFQKIYQKWFKENLLLRNQWEYWFSWINIKNVWHSTDRDLNKKKRQMKIHLNVKKNKCFISCYKTVSGYQASCSNNKWTVVYNISTSLHFRSKV